MKQVGEKKIKTNVQLKTTFRNNKKFQIGILGIAIFIIYARAINYKYIGFDDAILIVDNFKFIKDLSNIPRAFLQDVFQTARELGNEAKEYYRPIMTLSLMLDANISGTPNPKFYHFINIIYHIIACSLLLILFLRLKINSIAAFMFTLLFAVHPALTQAIAWIPGRNDILLAIFIISSFLFFLDYLESNKIQKLAAHILFFALALFSKETGVMLVAICFFYLQFISKEKIFSKTTLFLFLGYLVVIIPWFFLRKHALEGSSVNTSAMMAVSNIIQNWPLIFQYIGKVLFPFNLSVMFTIDDANYIFPVLSIIGIITGIYFTKEKRWNVLFFGCVWFLLFLIPSFSANRIEGLEHRLYLPLAGFMIMVAEFEWIKNISFQKNKTQLILASYIILLLVITNNRMSIFKTRSDFYYSAIKDSKSAVVPCINLAADYQEAGQIEKAMEMYTMALERDPNHNMLHNNMGVLYLRQKKYEMAEKEFLKELNLFPENGYATYGLAMVYAKIGKMEQAVEMWKKTTTVQNNITNAYEHLIQYYKEKGDTASGNLYQRKMKAVSR